MIILGALVVIIVVLPVFLKEEEVEGNAAQKNHPLRLIHLFKSRY